MEKYYVEFENTEDQHLFCLQSVWFDTKEEAINWYINSFDYINQETMIVSLMKSDFDENGHYTDIKIEEDITAKFNLRGDR